MALTGFLMAKHSQVGFPDPSREQVEEVHAQTVLWVAFIHSLEGWSGQMDGVLIGRGP